MQRRNVIGATALACALALSGCTSSGPRSSVGGRHPWTIPGTLRVGISIAPHSLNPILAQTAPEFMIARLVSDVLVTYDAGGQRLVPILAREVPTLANGGISRDGRVVVYHLRSGVRWHDGAPFTSEDVRFTHAAIVDGRNNVGSRHGYDEAASVAAPNPLTVRVTLKRPYAPFVAQFFGDGGEPYGVLPAHLLAHERSLETNAYNAHPIGTGPYKVTKWLRGDRVEYEANDDYFRGKPKIRKIIVRTIADDNALITQLRAHEIDWLSQTTAAVAQQLAHSPDHRLVLVPQNSYYAIRFNLTHSAVADVNVRRAVSASIDKAALSKRHTFGTAPVADVDIVNTNWAYPRGIPTYSFDLQRAATLFAKAGFTRNGTAPLQRNGKPLELELVANASSLLDRGVVVDVAQMLERVGVTVRVKTYPATYYGASYASGGVLYRGKFDAVLSRWLASGEPDNSAEFTCATIPPNGYNLAHYCDPEMDRLQARALSTYDERERARFYRAIETKVASDVPHIFLWWPRLVQAIDTDLHGFDPNPLIETWNVATWSI